MAVVKEITGAVMPWVVLAGVAVAVYKYRDEIIAWIKGEIIEKAVVPPAITPEGVTIPGPAGPARDIGQSVADWLLSIFRPDTGPVVVGPTAAETAAFVSGQIAGGTAFIIPGLSTWERREAEVPPAPSPLALALGLTGDPVSGYTSVMAPLPETPKPLPGNTYEAFAHLDVNPDPMGYDVCKDGICLNLRSYAWNVDRVDASGRFVGNIAAAGGSDPAVWAQLRQYIGLVT